ncbi:MAG: response regulator, partial [Peptostreptococcaceae bacterium]
MFNVLIVEDEYITRMFLSNIINWNEHDMNLVGVSKDGQEALDIMKNQSIDIIITDLKMPNIDGNELIRILKNKRYDGKIIVLSNYDDFSLVKDAMKNGAYEYLLKITINKDELINILNKAKYEIIENNKLINKKDIIEVSDEKLKVNEYIQEYLKGNEDTFINEEMKVKYLNKCIFIYLRALSTDIKNSEIEKRLNSFIYNLITNSSIYINSDIFSLVQVKRSEYCIVIKSSNNNLNIELLISNIIRNVSQYLNINFEKVLYEESIDINKCLEIIQNERKEERYKINS